MRGKPLPWILLGAALLITAVLCIALLVPRGGQAPVSAEAGVESTAVPAAAEEPAETAAPTPTVTETPAIRCELPDISIWVTGKPGRTELRDDPITNKDYVRQRFSYGDIDAFFSFIELLSDERYALEPITAKPVMSEYVYERRDYRQYVMMYRYTGEATITRDAVDPVWVPTEEQCDVLVVCNIDREEYETEEGREWKDHSVEYTLSAFPEASFVDAGQWDGTPPDNVPEPPVERTFSIRIGGRWPWTEHVYTTSETYLGPALEKAGALGWKTVDGKKTLYTVAGIPAHLDEGERWSVSTSLAGNTARSIDEMLVSDDWSYHFTLYKNGKTVEDRGRQPIETAPKKTEPPKKGLSFTVIVDANGSKKNLTVSTEEAMLGPALRALGLIEGSKESWGFFIRKVAGVEADEAAGEFWAVYKGGKTLQTGIDSTPIAAGDTYTFVLTK